MEITINLQAFNENVYIITYFYFKTAKIYFYDNQRVFVIKYLIKSLLYYKVYLDIYL